jgi:hypothetical protein
MIPHDHPILDEGKAIGKLIQCQAGDLVHCNSHAFITEEQQQNELVDYLRIVAYVSMSPTPFVHGYTIKEFRKERKLLVENNCTLSHWSTELVQTRKLKH